MASYPWWAQLILGFAAGVIFVLLVLGVYVWLNRRP